jgi:ABC-2 type transport system ATP-binding protein
MDKGRILKLDTPAALIRGLDAPVRISIKAGQLLAQQATELPGVDHVAEDPDGLVLTTRQPAEVLSRLGADNLLDGLQVKAATLEDVFLDVTGREYRA